MRLRKKVYVVDLVKNFGRCRKTPLINKRQGINLK